MSSTCRTRCSRVTKFLTANHETPYVLTFFDLTGGPMVLREMVRAFGERLMACREDSAGCTFVARLVIGGAACM